MGFTALSLTKGFSTVRVLFVKMLNPNAVELQRVAVRSTAGGYARPNVSLWISSMAHPC